MTASTKPRSDDYDNERQVTNMAICGHEFPVCGQALGHDGDHIPWGDGPPKTHTTDLYFEAHITIAPVTPTQKVTIGTIGLRHGFRMATFLLKKDSQAVPDDFFTGRSTDYDALLEKTLYLVDYLQQMDVTVKRYKIENTLLDVRVSVCS